MLETDIYQSNDIGGNYCIFGRSGSRSNWKILCQKEGDRFAPVKFNERSDALRMAKALSRGIPNEYKLI